MSFNQPKVLILGGSLFVGPAVIKLLAAQNYDITVLNRGNRPIAGTTQWVADRNNTETMMQYHDVADEFEVVIDLACYTEAQAKLAWNTFSKKTKRWVHLSTVAVYTDLNLSATEIDSIDSHDVWGEYGRNKAAADTFLLTQHEPPCIILRPPYLYGPNNSSDRETFVWQRALQHKPVLIPGDGETTAHFLHVEDLANAIYTVATAPVVPHDVYNISSNEPVSLQEYVTSLAEICNAPDPGTLVQSTGESHRTTDYFPFGNHHCGADATLFQTDFNWQPQYNFITGHQQTFQSYNIETLKQAVLDTSTEDEIISHLT